MLLHEAGESSCYVVGAITTPFGFEMKDPIFIIGTGRCGTSLLVRIPQSHKHLITFLREANNLWHPKSYPYGKKSVETLPILKVEPKEFSFDLSQVTSRNFKAGDCYQEKVDD